MEAGAASLGRAGAGGAGAEETVASHLLWSKTDLTLRHVSPGYSFNSLYVRNDDNFIWWL